MYSVDSLKAFAAWAEAKGYDTFCPISKFIPKNEMAAKGYGEYLYLFAGKDTAKK